MEYVTRTGKIFACGSYPDQRFDLSPDEMRQAVADFQPVPIDLSHVDTVLDGMLGELKAVRVADDGVTLIGTATLPRWLDERLTDGSRKVSCTWDRASKKLLRLALVPKPRIEGAALMGAAADTGAGEARFEAGFESVAATAHASGSDNDLPGDAVRRRTAAGAAFTHALPGRRTQRMTLLERIKHALGRAGVDPDAIIGEADFSEDAPPAGMTDTERAEFSALKAQSTALQTQLQQEREARFSDAAATFAETAIAGQRAFPAQRDALAALFLQLARDDAAGSATVTFGAGEAAFSGSRTKALAKLVAGYPQHHLTDELVAAGEPETILRDAVALFSRQETRPKDGEKPSEERKKQLLAMTAAGRAALNGEGK